MQKLSPHYRMDDADRLPAHIQEYLDHHYLTSLEHLTVPHPKLLVVFSGGSAIGKSTLSKYIQQELRALVLENDAIKRVLIQNDPNIGDERNKYTWQYSLELYRKLSSFTNNGLVVRDGLIDWYYDRILPIFFEQGYSLFVIAYDLTLEQRTELIMKRGDTDTANVKTLIELLDDQDIHIKRFRNEYTPDVVLKQDNLFDYEPVIEKLRLRIAELES